jgi:molybdate transport system substrate-binding protein
MTLFRTGVLLWSLICASQACAEGPARIAVAANFKATLEALIDAFAQSDPASQSNYQLVSGSTGMLFAQISAGAPFDLFLAADSARPEQLHAQSRFSRHHPKVYARGRLALWIPNRDGPWEAIFTNFEGDLAIANPALAPSGAAASVLLSAPLFQQAPRRIQGNNVHQAYQFVETGNAQGALISLAQLIQAKVPPDQYYLPPQTQYPAITQKRILLSDHPAALALDQFLATPSAAKIIRQAGYHAALVQE